METGVKSNLLGRMHSCSSSPCSWWSLPGARLQVAQFFTFFWRLVWAEQTDAYKEQKDGLLSVFSLFHLLLSLLDALVIVPAPAASIVVQEVEQYKVQSEQQPNSDVEPDENVCQGKKQQRLHARHRYVSSGTQREPSHYRCVP